MVLLLSGPVAVGKTSVATELVATFNFERVRSGAFLQRRAVELQRTSDRAGLQALGDELDEATGYRWLVDEVALPTLRERADQQRWLIDAVRKQQQVEHFRRAISGSVLHVHLDASECTLRARYESRMLAGEEYLGATPYDVAIQHQNEVASRGLRDVADAIVFVEGKTAAEVAAEIAGVLPRPG